MNDAQHKHISDAIHSHAIKLRGDLKQIAALCDVLQSFAEQHHNTAAADLLDKTDREIADLVGELFMKQCHPAVRACGPFARLRSWGAK